MKIYLPIGLLGFVFIFTGFSCINITVNGVDVPVDQFMDEEDTSNDTSVIVEDDSDMAVYGNSAGYSFTYDQSLTVWSDLDVATETVTESDETEAFITVSEVKPLLFQGEVNRLTFEVVPTIESPAEFAAQEIEEYAAARDINNSFGNPYSYEKTTLQGLDALDIYGGANIGSKYRVFIVDLGDDLLVIEQGMNEPRFNDIMNSLTIE